MNAAMRSWVFRNRARLEALCGRSRPEVAATRPAPGTLVRSESTWKSGRKRPRVITLLPARRRP